MGFFDEGFGLGFQEGLTGRRVHRPTEEELEADRLANVERQLRIEKLIREAQGAPVEARKAAADAASAELSNEEKEAALVVASDGLGRGETQSVPRYIGQPIGTPQKDTLDLLGANEEAVEFVDKTRAQMAGEITAEKEQAVRDAAKKQERSKRLDDLIDDVTDRVGLQNDEYLRSLMPDISQGELSRVRKADEQAENADEQKYDIETGRRIRRSQSEIDAGIRARPGAKTSTTEKLSGAERKISTAISKFLTDDLSYDDQTGELDPGEILKFKRALSKMVPDVDAAIDRIEQLEGYDLSALKGDMAVQATPDMKAEVLRLLDEGKTIEQIAEERPDLAPALQ